MADHISGPRALADPVIDITDLFAFPSPARPGTFVLVMNVFPFAAASALFSDAADYRLRVRAIRIAATGSAAAFTVGEPEYAFTFSFSAPQRREGSDALAQEGRCVAPTGATLTFQVNDERGARGTGWHVFAGLRRDPFFIDLPASMKTWTSRRLAFEAVGKNSMEGYNVLSLVVAFEIDTFFRPGAGPMFGIVGETLTQGSLPMRLERVGRPEIKNIIMGSKDADTVNRNLEIRDLYNQEDAFKLGKSYVGAYRARLNANLSVYDSLDEKIDWPPDEQGNHPLTDFLLADFLVVDMSKPFAEGSFLEIERAMFKGGAHRTCGGRWLDDDIMDEVYTLVINAGNGPRIRDGVDHAGVPSARTFPFVVPPNPNPLKPKPLVLAS